jgi:hypothetical protein
MLFGNKKIMVIILKTLVVVSGSHRHLAPNGFNSAYQYTLLAPPFSVADADATSADASTSLSCLMLLVFDGVHNPVGFLWPPVLSVCDPIRLLHGVSRQECDINENTAL